MILVRLCAAFSTALLLLYALSGCDARSSATSGEPITPASIMSEETAQRLDEAVRSYNDGDYDRAASLLEGLAEEGYAEPHIYLALMHFNALNSTRSIEAGVNHLLIATDIKKHDENFILSDIAGLQYLIEDESTLIDSFLQYFNAILPNAPDLANVMLCEIHHSSGDPDYSSAFTHCMRSAQDDSNVYSQYLVALMYYQGNGVLQDYRQAHFWMLRSAKNGYFNSQIEVARMYFQGLGTVQDFQRAHMWMNIAAYSTSWSGDFQRRLGEERNMIASRMTPEQIGRSQEMARRCLDSNYENCD